MLRTRFKPAQDGERGPGLIAGKGRSADEHQDDAELHGERGRAAHQTPAKSQDGDSRDQRRPQGPQPAKAEIAQREAEGDRGAHRQREFGAAEEKPETVERAMAPRMSIRVMYVLLSDAPATTSTAQPAREA